MLIGLLIILATMTVAGIVLISVSKDDVPSSPEKTSAVRFYNPERFSPFPLMPNRRLPIPRRSRRWQIGLGLFVYSWIAFCVVGLILFIRLLV